MISGNPEKQKLETKEQRQTALLIENIRFICNSTTVENILDSWDFICNFVGYI